MKSKAYFLFVFLKHVDRSAPESPTSTAFVASVAVSGSTTRCDHEQNAHMACREGQWRRSAAAFSKEAFLVAGTSFVGSSMASFTWKLVQGRHSRVRQAPQTDRQTDRQTPPASLSDALQSLPDASRGLPEKGRGFPLPFWGSPGPHRDPPPALPGRLQAPPPALPGRLQARTFRPQGVGGCCPCFGGSTENLPSWFSRMGAPSSPSLGRQL